MKIIRLHSKPTTIVYKNSLCSCATFVVFVINLLTLITPIFIIVWLNPYPGFAENLILFEQPDLQFQYKYLFIGETNSEEVITCSSFPYFNQITSKYQTCKGLKFWKEDFNNDWRMDKANFELRIDTVNEVELKTVHLILFFEAALGKNCLLQPPAIIFQQFNIPSEILPNGEVIINSHFKLMQKKEFICPFFGRKIKTNFHKEILHTNATQLDFFNIANLKKIIKSNVAYFESEVNEIYPKKQRRGGIKLNIGLEIFEIPIRYHLTIWERIGQFWLYYASFLIVTYCVSNKIKNFLFKRHVLRAWEIIPWEKFQ